MEKAGMFSEGEKLRYGSEDIRFTVNGNMLYATLLGWPQDGKAVIKSAAQLYPGEIAGITMLGDNEPLQWNYSDEGLIVSLPASKPCDYAWVLKIDRKPPF